MKIFRLAAIFSFILMSIQVVGQIKNDPYIKGKNDTIKVAVTNIDNELIPWFPLADVISPTPVYSNHPLRELNLTGYDIMF